VLTAKDSKPKSLDVSWYPAVQDCYTYVVAILQYSSCSGTLPKN